MFHAKKKQKKKNVFDVTPTLTQRLDYVIEREINGTRNAVGWIGTPFLQCRFL